MARSSTIPEVFGAKEACECLGIKSPNLRPTLKAGGIPEPDDWKPGARAVQLSSGPVWMAEDIRHLAKQLDERRRARAAAA